MAHGVTVIDCKWLAELCEPLCTLSTKVLESPAPHYDSKRDRVVCALQVRYGIHAWPLPSIEHTFPSSNAIEINDNDITTATNDNNNNNNNNNNNGDGDGNIDEYKHFAQALLAGDVIPDRFAPLSSSLLSNPSLCTRPYIQRKVIDLVTPV